MLNLYTRSCAHTDSKEQAGLVKMAHMFMHAWESRRESYRNYQLGNVNPPSGTGLISRDRCGYWNYISHAKKEREENIWKTSDRHEPSRKPRRALLQLLEKWFSHTFRFECSLRKWSLSLLTALHPPRVSDISSNSFWWSINMLSHNRLLVAFV